MTKKFKQILCTLLYYKYPFSNFQNVSLIGTFKICKKGTDNDFLNQIYATI